MALGNQTVSIHALLAECDLLYRRNRPAAPVSIHALLAECDGSRSQTEADQSCFNPRTPCGVRLVALIASDTIIGFNPRTPCGVRHCGPGPTAPRAKFQSTHSLRSATVKPIEAIAAGCSFNPRTPCGVRPVRRSRGDTLPMFQSTHSLRSATGRRVTAQRRSEFQSTHSLRSATVQVAVRILHYRVSIHALLAECDLAKAAFKSMPCCFNPRTPCGVRQPAGKAKKSVNQFQSTHSLRSATVLYPNIAASGSVSIHALLAECDPVEVQEPQEVQVSIHALLAECD